MLPMPHFDLSVIALCHSFAIAKEATEQALFNTGGPMQFPGSPYAKISAKVWPFQLIMLVQQSHKKESNHLDF